MSAKVDSTSAAEPHSIKVSGVTLSAASTSGQKLSIFAAKSGFVIPKNKLSGSLVPIFRGAKKYRVTGATNEDSSKEIQRKTKWGPDLTQDASVRRARASALQVRIDQITQQLKSGKLDVGNTEDSPLMADDPDQSCSVSQIVSKKSEMLELEKRESIGEILKLDPSYKPPPGYKPLLKEAIVPLPVKEYPGYNFIGLIYGPEGDNQKRLEKETGAKIQVHATKADTGEKCEIKPENDVQHTCEEMHVNISADSFDKVDAAVSIIELLITSVTGNLAAASTPPKSVSGNNAIVLSQSQDETSSHTFCVAMENQDVVQPVAGSTQMRGDNFQYSIPWILGVLPHTPEFTSSGNIAPQNPPGFARTPHFSSQTFNPSNMASTFGAQPASVTGFNSIMPNLSVVSLQSQPPRHILQHSHLTQTSLGQIGPPRNFSSTFLQTSSVLTNASSSFSATVTHPTPLRQLQTSVPSVPQPMSGISPAPLPHWPLTPLGVSSVHGGPPVTDQASAGFSNMGQLVSPAVPSLIPVSPHLQPDVALKPPLSSMGPRSACFSPHQAAIPPRPSSSLGLMTLPTPALAYSSGSHISGPVSFPSPGLSISHLPSQQSGILTSASGVTPYQTPVKPPVLTGSSFGNFTFQPQQPNADFQVAYKLNGQAATQCGTQEQSSGPQLSPFGFAVPDQPVNQIFPKPQVPNQVDQTQAHASAIHFGGRLGAISIPPRHPNGGQTGHRSPVPQIGMRNFIPAPPMPNLPSSGIPRARGMEIRQNYSAQKTWPDMLLPPNQKFDNNHSMTSGKPPYPADQIYDPFSPTSVAPPQQKGDHA